MGHLKRALAVAGEAVVRFSIDDVGAVVGPAQDAEEGEVSQGGVRVVDVRILLVKVRGGKTPAGDGLYVMVIGVPLCCRNNSLPRL